MRRIPPTPAASIGAASSPLAAPRDKSEHSLALVRARTLRRVVSGMRSLDLTSRAGVPADHS